VSFVSDSVWVTDAALGKFSLFSHTFDHVRDVILSYAFPAIATKGRPFGRIAIAEGFFIETTSADSIRWWYATGRGNVTQLPAAAATPSQRSDFQVQNRVMSLIQPFPQYPLLFNYGDAFVRVDRDRSDGVGITFLSTDASVIRSLTIPLGKYNVTDQFVAAEVERLSEPIKKAMPSLKRGTIRDAFRKAIQVPKKSFFLSAFSADEDQSGWLRQDPPGEPRSIWSRVDLNSGKVLAQLTIEKERNILILGHGYAWVLETDKDDVPFISKYRVAGRHDPQGR
jgi:hypothetical protein